MPITSGLPARLAGILYEVLREREKKEIERERREKVQVLPRLSLSFCQIYRGFYSKEISRRCLVPWPKVLNYLHLQKTAIEFASVILKGNMMALNVIRE